MKFQEPLLDSMDLQVDGQTAASWSEVIRGFDDANIYQTHAYGAERWGEKNLSHLVLSRGGLKLAAVQVRIVRTPILPVGVAFARWGPLCRPQGEALDSEVTGKMLECMRMEYSKRRGLVLQIIPGMFVGTGPGDTVAGAMARSGFREDSSMPSYRTIIVDLSPSAEVMRKRLNQKWRNQLNGSERSGLEFDVSEDESAYAEFLGLYDEMRDRKGFDSAVDVHEFGRIQERLAPGRKMTVFLARKDGQVVCALVCSLMGDTAIYLLGATGIPGRDLKASYFLHWNAILWLKSKGAQWYDLGGIDPDFNPGGYHFKSGFGGQDLMQHAPVSICDGWLGMAVSRGVSWARRSRARA